MKRLSATWESQNFRLWIIALVFSLAVFTLRDQLQWMQVYPTTWTVPLTSWLNVIFATLGDYNLPFRLMAMAAKAMMTWLQQVLHFIPWPILTLVLVFLAFRAAGKWLAMFALATCGYTVVVGLWEAMINTIALVGITIPFCLVIGFALGVWADKSQTARRIIEPILDLMQTVPAFSYLVPAMILFGFGPQVGLIVSIIFATPPMARNVFLGLRRVPAEIKEAADMAGGTPAQRFWIAELPNALPQIVVGINQAILAAFSMVIIASVIGGFNDIGWAVSGNYRRQALGQAFEAGIVITLFAILIDRIGAGFAHRSVMGLHHRIPFLKEPQVVVAITMAVIIATAAFFFDGLKAYPESWVVSIAEPINIAMDQFVKDYGAGLKKFKFYAVVFFLKPLEIGFDKSVVSRFWGFDLSPGVLVAYVLGVLALAGYLWHRLDWPAAIFMITIGTIFYWGCTGVPWPVWIFAVVLLAWIVGGRKIAIFAFFSLMFILLTGLWGKAMLSIYLVISAIVICISIGCTLGILASENKAVSWFTRALNDMLQSIPLYVLLIPPLWIFRTSEFASMLAIVIYAIVPCIRYTEFGLRQVPETNLEAARSMGLTRWQILWNVKIPMAIPEIMLGLNQTVLLGLSMLVIAALITSRGLGREIYTALGQRDPGLGIVAGLSMALIAITVDRILQSWSAKRKAALGVY